MAFDFDEASAKVYAGDEGRGLLWTPAAGVVVTRLQGRADLGSVRFYIEHAEQTMRRDGAIAVFHDWSEMGTYDADARDELKRWGAQEDKNFRGVHYLVRSKVVVMLISVAALTLRRKLHGYSDRETFLERLEQELAPPSSGRDGRRTP